jgi:hypothetical protein
MYCRTYDIGVKGIVPEGREMIMPGEDATMTLYTSKRMVCFFFSGKTSHFFFVLKYLGYGKRRSIYVTRCG